jgi:hypothetical protein
VLPNTKGVVGRMQPPRKLFLGEISKGEPMKKSENLYLPPEKFYKKNHKGGSRSKF